VGIRNPNGGGSGTNYWLTSDGGPDGAGSSTGYFSLDGGNTWQSEGVGWHHAFVMTGTTAVVLCERCLPDGTSVTFGLPQTFDDCYAAGGFPEGASACYPWDEPTDGDPPLCPGCCNNGATGDYPVHLFSGEKTEQVTDLRIPGRGFDFVLTRTYRSQAERATAQGHNWDTSYNIFFEQDGEKLVLRSGDHRRDEFHLRQDGSYQRGEYFRIVDVEDDDSIVMRLGDGNTWTFLPLDHPNAPGRIGEMRDRNGNAMSFQYDTGGQLIGVVDTLDREIAYFYNASGLLTDVVDFTGRTVHYEYYLDGDEGGGAGDLKSVTYPAVVGTPNGNDFPEGKTWTYTYSTGFQDARFNHNLLTVTDAKGQEFKALTYDTNPNSPDADRVIRQELGGDIIDYVYVPQSPAPENGFAENLTIVNDRMGNVEHLYFDAGHRLVMKEEYTGRADPRLPTTVTENRPLNRLRATDPAVFITRSVWDTDSLEAYSQEPARAEGQPRGPATIRVFDSSHEDPRPRGNMMERRRLPAPEDPNQDEIVEEFEYLGEFGGGCCGGGADFITLHVDGRGGETRHEYDDSANRIGTTERIATVAENWEFNAFGQVTAHVLPDNGSNHRRRDQYTYYNSGPQRGYLHEEIIDAGALALTTFYEYDDVGNVVRVIDPRGADTQYVVNALNQVVRTLSRAVDLGPGAVRYITDTYYDANDNVVRVDVQNVDDRGNVSPNEFLTRVTEYDLLNDPVRVCEESGAYTGDIPGPPELPTCDGLPADEFITTEYEYDLNKNRSLQRFGEATEGRQEDNVVRTLFDERDLVFQSIRAPGVPGPGGQSTTQYDYDTNRKPIRVIEGVEDEPRTTTHEYDGLNRLLRTVDAMGNETIRAYDDNHNLVSEIQMGELIDVPGSAGNVRLAETTYVYDDMDRLIRAETAHFDAETQEDILDGLSVSVTEWSANSQLRGTINDNLHATTQTYDTANRVEGVTDARGNKTTFEYDANSNLIRRTERERSDLGNPLETFVTTTKYDALDRLTEETDNVGNTRSVGYDSRGNGLVTRDALNHETRNVFDGISRLIRTVRDLDGNGADPDEMPGDHASPDIVTAQTWDDTSRLVAQTDDNGNATTYVHDALNRRIAEIMADGTQHASTYDVHDNIAAADDANGSHVENFHDLLNRRAARSVIPGPGVSDDTTFENHEYDGLSRMVRAEDDDSIVTRTYDSLSGVTSETLNGAATQSLIDGVGNKLACTYPGGRIIERAYDALERVGAITDATDPKNPAAVATYQYIGPARVERREYGNGTRTDYAYDGIDNDPGDFGVRMIVGTKHTKIAGGSVIDDRAFAWDREQNKTRREDLRAGGPRFRHAYAYDDLYRLGATTVTDETDPENPLVVRETGYELDGVGNRNRVSGPGPESGDYFMDPLDPPADRPVNQYSVIPADRREYDNNGNLVRIAAYGDFDADGRTDLDDFAVFYGCITGPGGSADWPCRRFDADNDADLDLYDFTAMQAVLSNADPTAPASLPVYDYKNRMVEALQLPPGITHRYAYDAFGRRIGRVVDSIQSIRETRYFYDGWQGHGATAATYVHGLYIDEVLNMQRDNDGNEVPENYYYHADDLYNVMAVTGDDGDVVERYEYFDYGRPEFFDASGESVFGSQIGNLYLFTGREFDPETGWYYYRTRYMDPIAGRFTTRDTIGIWGDTVNLGNGSAYVGNSPVANVDPSGRKNPCSTATGGVPGGDCTCTGSQKGKNGEFGSDGKCYRIELSIDPGDGYVGVGFVGFKEHGWISDPGIGSGGGGTGYGGGGGTGIMGGEDFHWAVNPGSGGVGFAGFEEHGWISEPGIGSGGSGPTNPGDPRPLTFPNGEGMLSPAPGGSACDLNPWLPGCPCGGVNPPDSCFGLGGMQTITDSTGVKKPIIIEPRDGTIVVMPLPPKPK
jgi:RHS repeat-associated protein